MKGKKHLGSLSKASAIKRIPAKAHVMNCDGQESALAMFGCKMDALIDGWKGN